MIEFGITRVRSHAQIDTDCRLERLDGVVAARYRPGLRVRPPTPRPTAWSPTGWRATSSRIWRERYRHIVIPEGVTLLFEIIYPNNR